MAVKVRRTFRGETSRTADDGKEETWYFDVEADSLTYTVTQAKTAVDSVDGTNPLKYIPAINRIHPEDPELICKDVSADRDADLPTLIRVAVTWRSIQSNTGGDDGANGEDDGSSSGDPTPYWGVELAFDREGYTEEVNCTKDKKAFVNAAGDPMEPIQLNKSDAIYIYSFYVKNLDWDAMGEADGAINKNPITLRYNGRTKSFAKHTLKIAPRFNPMQTIEPTTEGGSRDVIYKVECRLAHNKNGWRPKLVNKGLNYLDDDGKYRRALDDTGQPTSSEILLDRDGKKLAAGATAVLLPLAASPGDPSPGYDVLDELAFETLPGFGG